MTHMGDHQIGQLMVQTPAADEGKHSFLRRPGPTPASWFASSTPAITGHRNKYGAQLTHLRGGGKRGKEHDARQATLYRPQRGRNGAHCSTFPSRPHHAQKRLGASPAAPYLQNVHLTARGHAQRHRQEKERGGGRVKAGAQTKRGNVSSRAPHAGTKCGH